MSTKNFSSFNFSFTSNILNQPVEFYLDHMLENTKGLLHSPKSATQLSFWLKNTINNQPVFEVHVMSLLNRFDYNMYIM